MILLLVRHAQPKPKEEDPDRPLSDEGRLQIRKTAAFAAQYINMPFGIIMHSGKTRASQTAEVLGEYLQPAKGVMRAEGLNPMDDPNIWAKRVTEYNENIALVGHLPHMAKLATTLLFEKKAEPIIEFEAAAIVCLNRNDDGNWMLAWMISPDMIDSR